MRTLLLLSILGMQAASAGLHPALLPDEATLRKVWQAGYERAKTDKTLYRAHKLAKRGIGRINNKDVSWVLWRHPRLRAFEQGFAAHKNDWTPEQQEDSRRILAQIAPESGKTLHFRCELGMYPKLGSGGIHRIADIRNLNGVTAVVQIGDKSYAPVQQPGDIEPTVHEGIHEWSEQVPIRTYEVKDKDGNTRTETEYITVCHQVEYRYFTGTFDLMFDLKNEDGTPRIKESDTEFTVIIKGKFGSQKATYVLKDWLTAYEK